MIKHTVRRNPKINISIKIYMYIKLTAQYNLKYMYFEE